jgi:hypothetical protein
MNHRRKRRRGSTLVEFVFVLPLGIALLVGGLSVGSACLRSLQAGQFARDVAILADSGVDFGTAPGMQQLVERGKEIGLEKGQAAVYVKKVVREPAGMRVDRTFQAGDTTRWSASAALPGDDLGLQAGEEAWVVEVIADSGSITSFVPQVVKVRNVL